jgi:hypothetical protein
MVLLFDSSSLLGTPAAILGVSWIYLLFFFKGS